MWTWLDKLLIRLGAAAFGRQKSRRGTRGERLMGGIGGGGGFGWPGGWSQDRWAQVRNYRDWLYIGIRAIANEIARHEPNVSIVSEARGDGQNRIAFPAGRQGGKLLPGYATTTKSATTLRARMKGLNKPLEHEELTPVRNDHPLLKLLRQPNAYDSAPDFWFELILFLKLTGNSYIWTLLNGASKPTEMWVTPAHWVKPMAGKDRLIDYYDINPYGSTGGTIGFRLPESEMIHFRDKNPLHKVDGFSPLSASPEVIDTASAINVSRWSSFKNGTRPGLHLALGPTTDNSDEELARIYAKYNQRFQGESKDGSLIITSNGDALEKISFTPAEMMWLESADQVRDTVLALLGVPKEITGIQPTGSEMSWYAPLRQFCRFTISPILRVMGPILTNRLAKIYGEDIRIWYDDPTPDDPAQLNADIASDVASNSITPDEIRTIRGREPFPGGKGDEDPKQFDMKIQRAIRAGNALRVDEYRELEGWEPIGGEEGQQFIGVRVTARTGDTSEEPGIQPGEGSQNTLPSLPKTPAFPTVPSANGKGHNRIKALANGASRIARAFDETQHPRGQPGNVGQFGAGAATEVVAKPEAALSAESVRTLLADHAQLDTAAEERATGIISRLKNLVPASIRSAVNSVKDSLRQAAVDRYGEVNAGIIFKVALLSAPVPLPGSQPAAIAIALVLAEGVRAFKKLTGKELALRVERLEKMNKGAIPITDIRSAIPSIEALLKADLEALEMEKKRADDAVAEKKRLAREERERERAEFLAAIRKDDEARAAAKRAIEERDAAIASIREVRASLSQLQTSSVEDRNEIIAVIRSTLATDINSAVRAALPSPIVSRRPEYNRSTDLMSRIVCTHADGTTSVQVIERDRSGNAVGIIQE